MPETFYATTVAVCCGQISSTIVGTIIVQKSVYILRLYRSLPGRVSNFTCVMYECRLRRFMTIYKTYWKIRPPGFNGGAAAEAATWLTTLLFYFQSTDQKEDYPTPSSTGLGLADAAFR